MPTRVITGGFGGHPRHSMAERRIYFREHFDPHQGSCLMNEPRGTRHCAGSSCSRPPAPTPTGRAVHQVSGYLRDVRSGDDRGGHRPGWRPGWCGGRRGRLPPSVSRCQAGWSWWTCRSKDGVGGSR
ncbi:proline racemase family protein [Nonomuraea dietziae]|uniref:proline racemase family protein n=1 Tax=Nonomuraea dietziae TaxID=65515 RepID=UPI0031D263ED